MNNRLKYLQQKTLRLTVSPGVYITVSYTHLTLPTTSRV